MWWILLSKLICIVVESYRGHRRRPTSKKNQIWEGGGRGGARNIKKWIQERGWVVVADDDNNNYNKRIRNQGHTQGILEGGLDVKECERHGDGQKERGREEKKRSCRGTNIGAV